MKFCGYDRPVVPPAAEGGGDEEEDEEARGGGGGEGAEGGGIKEFANDIMQSSTRADAREETAALRGRRTVIVASGLEEKQMSYPRGWIAMSGSRKVTLKGGREDGSEE